MSDVVEIGNNNKPFVVLESSKTSNNSQEQEINDLSEFVKLDRKKYMQYKIIYDTLEECVSENSDMDITLKNKVNTILLRENVAQCLSLDVNMVDERNTCLFGSYTDDFDLNYTERNQLQEMLKLRLDQKCNNIGNESCSKALKTGQDSVPLQMSTEDKVLIDYKNNLMCEQKKYIENLLNLLDMLKEITNLRLKKLPQVTELKIKECQVEEKTNHIKSLLAQEKVRIDVFTETSNSLKAYKELIKDIKEQQQDCEKEILNLKELKEKYDTVSCKQYDDILKSYLQLKAAIEKKKLLYDCLKS